MKHITNPSAYQLANKRAAEELKTLDEVVKRHATMDMTVGEAVDDAVDKLRTVGIVIEGGAAHLTHAILRSSMTKAIEQVRKAEATQNDLENNKALQQ